MTEPQTETLKAYEFKHCSTAGIVKATIDDIAEVGWPICPECGDDMERISRPTEEPVKGEVRVTVEGGVVQNVQHPPGIPVIVRDYDIDRNDEGADLLPTDENGDRFLETTW